MSEHVTPSDPALEPGPDPHQSAVVAVLVCHNGEDYLPRTLAALAALNPAPAALVAIDTGSTDQTPELLAAASAATGDDGAGIHRVLTAPEGTGFAEAVHLAVGVAPDSDWLWLLHDDSAPDPDALGVLLQSAAGQASVAVWGPKVLGWDEPRRLLEIGVSISRSGRRYTGLERGEQDQGQYDGQRDVLAVGSAGLLARRDVWSDLGGFERSMHFFREDVDFGWRVNLAGHRVAVSTDAVIHHAESMARGRRTTSVTDPQAHDRASALSTLLANARPSTWLLRWLWLLLQTLLRSLGFVLGKAPREAAAEITAAGSVLMRPGHILRVRRSRRRWRKVPQRSLRSLFPPPGQQVRHTLETLAGSLTIEADVETGAPAGGQGGLETGPVDDDLDSFIAAGSGRLRRLLRRPGVLLFSGLLLVQLVAWRGLYRGGVLHGGALLPVPRGASDVWQAYVASWHPVTLGSGTMAHPSSAVLGLFGTLLLGNASLAVPTILLLGPPVAGVLAYQVTKSFGLSRRLRLAVGVAYGLNPVTLAATAQGRWTTVLVMVMLPLVGVVSARGVGMGRLPTSSRATALAVLLLGITIALAPTLILLTSVCAISLAIWLTGRRRVMALALFVGPLVLLGPWWQVVVQDPTVLLIEPGVWLTSDNEPPWHAVFFDPGGLWSLPWWIGIGLTLAACTAALRADRARPVRVALVVLCTSLMWALVLESITLTPANSSLPVAPWSGAVLVFAVAAAVVAAAVAARGARERLSTAAFSWRQPGLAAVSVLAVASVAMWGVGWLTHGANDPLDRGTANPLPAFVRAQSALPEQIRTLILEPAQGRLAYTLLRSRDAQWGDVETAPAAADMRSMDEVVADLASGRGSAPVDELTDRAVQYILAVPPVDNDLEVALDSAPGLLRIANPGEASLWQVQEKTGRVRQLESNGHREVLPSEVAGNPSAAEVHVDAADADRVLELAELHDDSWQATATNTASDTSALSSPSTSDWAERFIAGTDQATVLMTVVDRPRQWLLWGQLAAIVVLVLIALPGRVRRDEEAV